MGKAKGQAAGRKRVRRALRGPEAAETVQRPRKAVGRRAVGSSRTAASGGGALRSPAVEAAAEGGITADAGLLIGIERRDQRALAVLSIAARDQLRITVPSVVLTECWRGQTSKNWNTILAAVDVEAVGEHVAKLAGEAIAQVPGATVVDAIVMASAALRGDVVYTPDHDDLSRLQAIFPNVRLLRV